MSARAVGFGRFRVPTRQRLDVSTTCWYAMSEASITRIDSATRSKVTACASCSLYVWMVPSSSSNVYVRSPRKRRVGSTYLGPKIFLMNFICLCGVSRPSYNFRRSARMVSILAAIEEEPGSRRTSDKMLDCANANTLFVMAIISCTAVWWQPWRTRSFARP